MCILGLRKWTMSAVVLSLVFSHTSVRAIDDASAHAEDAGQHEFKSTHKQALIIKPMHDGQPVSLNTFCLDRDGNILACVGGNSVVYVVNDDGSQQAKVIDAPKQLQVYSPKGELLRLVDLEFQPTAVNAAPDGSVFVAGMGKVAHVNADGRILKTVDSPHIGDLESFRKRIEEAAQKQLEGNTARYREQIARIEERIKAIEEKPKEEITTLDERRIQTYQQQKKLYETQLKSFGTSRGQAASSDLAVSRRLGITSLAVTSKDLFLCTYSAEGTGYEIWRTTHEFSEPKMVVSQLRGCCGQCDIQATDEHLVLAENTKFKVALLDRDGERLMDFGKGDRKAVDGFGSCCNPMNVRCCDNGDILTAESSVGTIKRFSKDGKLLGVVGKAKIGGGCKHVAVAFDEKRDRYYMMNVDKDHVCVLVPNAEAPELTPDEALAKTAREGLGEKLIGAWSLDGKSPDTPKAVKPEADAKEKSKSLVRAASTIRVDPYSSSYLKFEADGNLVTKGGQTTADQGWECIRQDGNTLFVSKIQGNIQYYDYKIEFVDENEATISLLFNERVLSSNRYKRIVEEEAASEEAEQR